MISGEKRVPADAEKLLRDNFKLSLYEARVYLASVKGRMTPKQLALESQVPLPRIYYTLRSLQSKGFI
jgi:sugar-specific transcriptional regulator TrmB